MFIKESHRVSWFLSRDLCNRKKKKKHLCNAAEQNLVEELFGKTQPSLTRLWPLLISRVHEEVTILYVPLLAACPFDAYGEGCSQTCSCRNNGICHPASGRCSCTPGWTGPNCTEGGCTHNIGHWSKGQATDGPKYSFVRVFFSQTVLQRFMAQTVSRAACVRMEPPATRLMGNVRVPKDGPAQPVSWVRTEESAHL